MNSPENYGGKRREAFTCPVCVVIYSIGRRRGNEYCAKERRHAKDTDMTLRDFFIPPAFTSVEHTRLARLIHAALLMVIAAVTVFTLIEVFLLPQNVHRWLTMLISIDVCFLLLIGINRLGATRAAGIVLLTTLWVALTAAALTAGGVSGVAMTGYLVLILLAGLLFGEKIGVGVGVLSAFTTLWLAFLEMTNRLPATSVVHTPLSRWSAEMLFIVVIVSIQFLAVRSIRQALQATQKALMERQRADVALAQSEERYRSLVVATAQIVWTTDAEGQVVSDVSSWQQFTGQSAEEVLGSGWLEAIHPDDRERTEKMWKQAVTTHSMYETEYRVQRADGEWRYMAVRGVPVMGPDRCVREWVGACYDITTRKRAENENRAFNEILEHIASATAFTTGEEYFCTLVRHLAKALNIRYTFVGQLVNNNEVKIRTLAAWAGDGYAENFDYALAKTPCEKVIAGTICVYRREVRQLFPDDLLLEQMGVESYCGTPVRGKNGQPLGLLVVLDDKPLSAPEGRLRTILEIFAARAGMELERMRIDEALRQSEEKFAKAFRSSPVVLTILTAADMRFVTVNEAYTAVTGFTEEEVLGRTMMEIGMVSDPARLQEFRNILEGRGRVRNMEYEFRIKSGEIRIGLSSAETIEISGTPCLLVMSEDITERKRAELVLRRSRDELEQLVRQRTEELEVTNKELEAFSYTVSHDLQSPVRAIRGFAKAVAEDYHNQLDAEGADFLKRIVDASERMSALITDLLKYSRSGRRQPMLRAVALDELVRSIISEFSLRLRQIGADVKISTLPVVLGDSTLLVQTFSNLFQNAINYRKADSPLHIDVSAREADDAVVVCIKDNGTGIAPQNHRKIFEAFKRIQTASGITGSGLGLANVKKSVETMGGSVWVESELGKGSIFCVKLTRA